MKSQPLLAVLLAWSVTASPSGPATEPAAAASRPNVLFLFADDMRADSIGALGNPAVKTPNLDALVRRGFVLHPKPAAFTPPAGEELKRLKARWRMN